MGTVVAALDTRMESRRRGWIAVLSAAASFLIYAAAALIIQEDQKFCCEHSSFAAAASNAYYSAPLGKVYSGVLEEFFEGKLSFDEVLARASRREIAPGNLLDTTWDGNGIGYMVLASVGLRLFGPHTRSAVLVMLLLMGMSTLAFLMRYQDTHASIVVVYFTSLTLMAFTPLVWSELYSMQIPIGGIRYFSMLAILPAFHLLLECVEAANVDARWSARVIALAGGAQVVVLVLAILVRNSAMPMLAALAVGAALTAWVNRGIPGAARRILRISGYFVIIGAMFVSILMLSVSKGYLRDGRFTETVWHRIFVSVGLNPAWPFGNLREIYDCRSEIPEGLVPGPTDRNGHCILWLYAAKHDIPPSTVPTLTYGRQYDAAVREAFFEILRLYPGDVLKTFFYIKPRYIVWSIGTSLDFKLSAHSALNGLLAAALANLLLFATFAAPIPSSSTKLHIGITGLFAAFSIIPYIAVWAMPHTSADLLLCCMVIIGFATVAVVQKVRGLLLSTEPKYPLSQKL